MAVLLIVESPAKAKTIEKYLGSGYRVAASVGHIRDLPDRSMGVHAPDFRPDYVYTDRGKEVVARLQRLASECDGILLASDLDREGEAIAWHLQQVLKLDIKNANRITFNEITKKAIQAAVQKPRSINLQDVAAQEARRVVDRFIGYMVSPIVAEILGDRTISAGRVQSIAVRLVVDRENEITGHSVLHHFGVSLRFAGWDAKWQFKELLDGGKHWTDQAFAEKVAAVRNVQVVSCEDSDTQSSPPAPFSTSTLQAAGSNTLGFNPKKTMELAQKLYEQGAITYMRTDSAALSQDALDAIFAHGREAGLPMLDAPRVWKDGDDAQGAHEAIRPSQIDVLEAGESEDERKLYRLIWARTVGSQLQEARFAVRTAVLKAEDIDGKAIRFVARSKKLVHQGWKALTPVDTAMDPDDAAAADMEDGDNQVPLLTPGDYLDANSADLVKGKTNPPGRYTEASLVAELKRRGIGRPSTYGAIIETVTSTRGYLEVSGKKKQLKPTARGNRLINVIRANFKFIEFDFTKILETQLEAIATGKQTYKSLLGIVHKRLSDEINEFKSKVKVLHPCPKCGRGLLFNPATKKGSAWWSCSAYDPEGEGCDYHAQDADGEPGKASTGPTMTEYACGSCGKPLVHMVKEAMDGEGGWQFFSCSGYKQGCKQSYPDREGQPDLTAPRIKSKEAMQE